MIKNLRHRFSSTFMATIRFKFRSAAIFDSVEIGEQSSISIRDLKSKIVLKKHLNLCQDFDLVFSDSISGQEYTDENIRIHSGSSVIIKRVPAASSPSLRASDTSAGCFRVVDAECVDVFDPPMDVGANNFDGFGVDLFPPLHTNVSDTDKLLLNNNGKRDSVAPRGSQELLVQCQKLDTGQPAQSTLKDSSANEGSTLVMPKPKIEEKTQPERTSPAKPLDIENRDMPSELKCSLCRTFFKEAVMIPCCQHSFCGKCIRLALSENGNCPMCLSTKCKPEDLLPNVSLRQAIERFLESQLLSNGSDNDLQRYAPDGESGIQVKDVSSATFVRPRHLQLSQSAAWNKSNEIMKSKLHDGVHPADKSGGTLEDFSEFQGENDPQNVVHGNKEEVSCSKKGERSNVVTGGVQRNFTALGRPIKAPRTCYMCGSPDHLVRDCPGAAHCSTSQWNGVASFPGTFSGYPPPYWPGSPPHSGPFINMYGGPGMMFYNTTTAPISPYAFPPYAPSMYGGYPVSNYANIGGITPAVGNVALQPRRAEDLKLQDFTKQRNHDVDLERDRNFDSGHDVNARHDFLERGPVHSGDGFARRSEGKHRSRDNPDRSSSETNVRDSRIRPRDSSHEKLHRTFQKNDEIRAQPGLDSVQKHYQPKKESSKRKRMEHDKRSDRHSHSRSRSSLEQSYSNGETRQGKKGSPHRSRHTNKIAKYSGKETHHDRRHIRYSDDYEEDCHNKRKHFH